MSLYISKLYRNITAEKEKYSHSYVAYCGIKIRGKIPLEYCSHYLSPPSPCVSLINTSSREYSSL